MSISLNNTQDLRNLLSTKKIEVVWTVKSDIGPEWIGGGRTISFYLDNVQIQNTSFINSFSEVLIEKLQIPNDGGDYMIDGDGEIFMDNGDVAINFTTVSNIPYAFEFIHNNGHSILIPKI